MKLTAFPHAAESFKRGNMKICDNFGHFLKISAFKDVTSQNISVGYISLICLFKTHRNLSDDIFEIFLSLFVRNVRTFDFG